MSTTVPTVREVMTRTVRAVRACAGADALAGSGAGRRCGPTVGPDASVSVAARVMAEVRAERLLVAADNGSPVGAVSRHQAGPALPPREAAGAR